MFQTLLLLSEYFLELTILEAYKNVSEETMKLYRVTPTKLEQ